jgi:acetyl esterase/lipase
MPSQAMQDLIDALRARQKSGASQALLLSDSERLVTAATEAGVDVTLQIGEGLPHVYQLMLGTPEAAEATEQIGRFLRARVR